MVDVKIKGNTVEPAKPQISSSGSSPKTGGPAFSDSVKSARRTVLDGELKAMLEQTRTLGDTFFRSPDEGKLDRYKSAIREYLDRARNELFSLKQEFGSAQGGQQKVFQLVETVNKEVDDLTRETLQKDKALQLLGSLDDIRGLVLDLIT